MWGAEAGAEEGGERGAVDTDDDTWVGLHLPRHRPTTTTTATAMKLMAAATAVVAVVVVVLAMPGLAAREAGEMGWIRGRA